ncbi:hypothetical protein [Flavobacterium luteolum]|uniref:hypothetical protein n=1 Tax=Flavobacterium luteolum TaxID=3003259 RepID=UPI000EB076ED|nr:hypothetical protein [Flavobacterium luteolum]
MEILLNELSFHNQFESFEHFQNGALIEIINFLDLQKSGKSTVLKKSDIYSKKVYQNKSLHEILISKDKEGKSDEIRKLKSQLGSIIYAPYWDINKLCCGESKYFYQKENVNDTCLAESFERESNIISISPSNFLLDELSVSKNEELKNIFNFYSFKSLLKKQYETNIVSFDFFCKHFFKGTKLNFSFVNVNESFKHISTKNEEEEFFNSFKMFSEMEWNDIIQQGGKGENKVGLAYQKYHDQEYFKKYNPTNPIYKFRTTQKYRVFGYRLDDTFYVLEFDLSHRLSD